jgi:FHA domain
MRIRLSARYQWEDTNSPPFFDQTFTGPRITIGNSPDASLSLNGSVLSGEQILILLEETEPQIINQAEGTSLNGERLELNLSRPLRHGDVLALGTYQISVAFDGEASAALENDVFASGNGEAVVLKEAPLPQPNNRPNAPRSFAAILDSLRTDEDRFYFVIEGGTQSGGRIPIELDETPLGWDATGELFGVDISSIAELSALVHKDWSGVVLRPQTGAAITINGEPVEVERRLRDGDRVLLNPPFRNNADNTPVLLIFHEPTSLVILDSVMPRPLREDSAPAIENGPAAGGVARNRLQNPLQKLGALITSEKEILSVFTFVELSLMVIGTLVGAVIIFLILNFS